LRRFLRIAFRLYAGLLTLSFDAVAPVWADPGSNTPPHHELLLVLSPEDARFPQMPGFSPYLREERSSRSVIGTEFFP
jgi:hypothetical protein